MRAVVLFIPILIAVSAAAPAQTVAPASGTVATVTVLAPLPSPNLSEDAKPSDVLRAAEGALAAGRTGEAQDALEMAETRMLDRSVSLGQTNDPSQNPTVEQISHALQALTAHDRLTCMQFIGTAITSATAQGL